MSYEINKFISSIRRSFRNIRRMIGIDNKTSVPTNTYKLIEVIDVESALGAKGRFRNHRRLCCFAKKGVKCVSCGIEGNIVLIEEWPNNGGRHVDLYACNKDKRVLMTVDHIIPKSKGGANRLSNYQPMCAPCNFKKGNNYDIA